MHLIWVYGTLREGGRNHHRLGEAVAAGKATCRGRMATLHGWFPGFQPDPHGPDVVGELYLVDDRTLAHLDRMEGVPRVYRRERLEVEPVSRLNRKAWAYVWVEPLFGEWATDWIKWEAARSAAD